MLHYDQLEQRIRDTIADAVKWRVEVHLGRHDGVTIDGQKVTTMGNWVPQVSNWGTAEELMRGAGLIRDQSQSQLAKLRASWEEAREAVGTGAFYFGVQISRSLLSYPNLSINDAVRSGNPIIRAFAMLDKRYGKRRLAKFDSSNEHPMVRQFHLFRCEAEDVRLRPAYDPS